MKRMLFCALLLLSSFILHAEHLEPRDNDWHFIIYPYLWAPWSNGFVSTATRRADINTTPIDIFQQFNGGAEVHMEARIDPFCFILDPSIVIVENTENGMRSKLTSFFTDFGLYTRVFEKRWKKKMRTLYGDVYFGARYWYYKLKVSLQDDFDFEPISRTLKWTDPTIGGRLQYYVKENYLFFVSGDRGGFDYGSKVSWQAKVGMAWQIKDNLAAALAFRILKVDYHTGNLVINTKQYGPLLGVAFVL